MLSRCEYSTKNSWILTKMLRNVKACALWSEWANISVSFEVPVVAVLQRAPVVMQCSSLQQPDTNWLQVSLETLDQVYFVCVRSRHECCSDTADLIHHQCCVLSSDLWIYEQGDAVGDTKKKLNWANCDLDSRWNHSSAWKQAEHLLKCPRAKAPPPSRCVPLQYFCIWPLTSVNAVKVSTVFFHRTELWASNELRVSQGLALEKAPREKCWIILPPYSPGLFPTAAHSASKQTVDMSCPDHGRRHHCAQRETNMAAQLLMCFLSETRL